MQIPQDYQTNTEHRMIFDELKAIRQDLKEVMTLTRKEMTDNLRDIKDDISAMANKQEETDRVARESLIIASNARNVIWGVGSVMILVLMGAIWKAGGFGG